ncbi:uncharacterized protein A4U43_C09F10 [Asparagus officinalis]|uniref:Uncharacterized protein n=1 Tax=Asparagus officinalis TaxID=4686 RepID=A0A5P1E4E2_ASPOF|nr:uncharacterized protein A4U43_C09F10 [Asparagus officinalis]
MTMRVILGISGGQEEVVVEVGTKATRFCNEQRMVRGCVEVGVGDKVEVVVLLAVEVEGYAAAAANFGSWRTPPGLSDAAAASEWERISL